MKLTRQEMALIHDLLHRVRDTLYQDTDGQWRENADDFIVSLDSHEKLLLDKLIEKF